LDEFEAISGLRIVLTFMGAIIALVGSLLIQQRQHVSEELLQLPLAAMRSWYHK